MAELINVLIVDDHPIFRDGFSLFLKNFDFISKIFEAPDVSIFLDIIKNQKIDIAFVDINLPGIDGIQGTKEAKILQPGLKIIGISSYEDIAYIDNMLASGAVGYLSKDASKEEIFAAINKVLTGEYYFSSKILALLTKRTVNENDDKSFKKIISEITTREMEVLKLFCKGDSRIEIAQKLFISERTVDKHRENLQQKTNTGNLVKLVLFAVKHEIIR